MLQILPGYLSVSTSITVQCFQPFLWFIIETLQQILPKGKLHLVKQPITVKLD